jgi:PDZ domain
VNNLSLFVAVLLSASIVAAQETVTIPAGTAVRIRTTQSVSSETARVGDDVPMEVLADVAVNGYVLIRQGAPVIGVISRAKESKILGRGGHVAVSPKYAESVTGAHVPVSGDRSEQGNGKKAKIATEVVVATAFTPLGLLFLFEKGNDSAIAPGTAFTVYAAADTQIDLDQLPKGAKLLRARPTGPENLPALGIVIDTNPTDFFARITGVVRDGAGDRAGLRVGYIITTVNRASTHNVRDVIEAIAALPPESTTLILGYAFPSNLGYMPKETSVRLKQ